ncbi:MAG TPA: hypothetical protein PLI59_13095 [Candidatus Obscuribacter sp.]|nr:hypothetical protein [Candidatus Obscuribacter sp.]HMY55896.1 hypothetical protein [Candidatus Obscuribacter sp.]HNG20109.1 hypothetical protein [Candidatus Obscuribacter sp.]
MPEFIKVLFADSPLLVGIFALSALLFILWFLNKFIYSNSNEVSTDLSSKAKLAVVKNAYDQDADDENITATGIVQRTVAVDNANYFHLAVRLDRPLSQLDGGNMLRFSEDYGFIDLPLVKEGDRVSLEFSFDEDNNVELIEFTWLPEQAA